MDGQYDHNEFEHFLKENADAHRLYPSERVWERIHSRMHGRQRKAIVWLLLIPLLAAMGWFLSEPSTTLPISTFKTTTHPATASVATKSTSLKEVYTSSTAKPASLFSNELAPKDQLEIEPAFTPTQEPIASSYQQIAAPATEAITTVPTTENISVTKQDIVSERYPLDIESVVNSYQRQLHRPRFRWQLHFTPTVSYRSLQEDQKFIAQARISSAAAAPANANSTDLSSVVRHRPDLGMQLGFTGTYPISKKIDWVTGIQFNVSKYDIEAYSYPSEVATIALMNPWGGTSTVSTLTSFRSSGFRSTANWLRNYYYSISLPIGLQWRILGKKHTHWGISATAQPTYVVGNRSYVISVDYQNYAEVPYLINKWNLNVGLETYARFQLGKNDFQIGPQIRYQASSSFKKGYPVQEHLYDFGIKLGMILGK
jgi:hypothetical protein